MTADHDYLLDAYQHLVNPQTVRFVQHNAAGISCTSEQVRPSLIDQLREAVLSSIGSKGAASLGQFRIPFNAVAYAMFDKIEEAAREWFLELDHPPAHDTIEANLAGWWLGVRKARERGTMADEVERLYQKDLSRWARQITEMFDPVTLMEVSVDYLEPIVDEFGVPKLTRRKEPRMRKTTRPAECPECGERFAHDGDTGDRITALIIEYRASAEDVLESAKARCRFCTTTWEGNTGVRALRWAIEEKEKELANG